MATYQCENAPSCNNVQSAICLHCNRRLCVQHITEHNQIIPNTIKNINQELQTTLIQIHAKYESSQNVYFDLLSSLNQWRAHQIQQIENVYGRNLQSIELQQENMNKLHQKLTNELEHDVRQKLDFVLTQKSDLMNKLYQVHQVIQQIEKQSTAIKWDFSLLPSLKYTNQHLHNPIDKNEQMPISKPNRPEKANKRKRSLEAESTSQDTTDIFNLRRYRSYRRLVDMFSNTAFLERSKNDIDLYLKQQGTQFQLPTLICSYLTAWHRKSDPNEKNVVLHEHLSTVAQYLSNQHSGYVVLLGVHAFIYNEELKKNPKEVMEYLLKLFLDRKCIRSDELLTWYQNIHLYETGKLDNEEKLCIAFIRSLWKDDKDPTAQMSSSDQPTATPMKIIEAKQEPV